MRKFLVVAALAALLAPAAHAQDVEVHAGLRIVAARSLKCLDVAGASLADGAPVVQYACHLGHQQVWEPWPLDLGYVQLRAAHSGKCLDVAQGSTDSGALLVQQPCTGGASQQWSVVSDAGDLGLVVRHSQKCAEIDGGSMADGAAVVQWACSPTRAQQFLLLPSGSATVTE